MSIAPSSAVAPDNKSRLSLKQRLRQGDICTGTFLIFLAGGDIAQFLAARGLDFFYLCLEHSAFDLSQARETILAARASGIAPLVRVAQAEYHLIARVLDIGAEGIVLPRVETPEEVERLVKYSTYAPAGLRGISTVGGHADYAPIPDVPAFLSGRDRDILRIVQIETSLGFERREEILSVSGLDACLIGTGDLAMNMGLAGQPDHPAVLEAAEKVYEVCRQKNVIFTLPIRKPEDVRRWQQTGMNMLSLGTDAVFITNGLNQFMAKIERAAGR